MLKTLRLHSLSLSFLWVLSACLWEQSNYAQESPLATALDTQRVDAAVQAQMTSQSLVGVSIGIIQNDQIVYTQGYGTANRDAQSPMSSKTIVNWASCSKPLVATLSMRLVQEEKLDLDAPIERYLPELPQRLKPITTRQLLCHQSGIPHYANGIILPGTYPNGSGEKLDPITSLTRFLNSPLIFRPGSKMDYSSYADVLLSAVVQSAGGAPLTEQVETRIVGPLGLESFQLDLEYMNQPDWAIGYRVVNGMIEKQAEVAHYWKHGAGGYKSNVEDFARFTLALLKEELITAESSRTMWTRQNLTDGTETEYGLGVRVDGAGSRLRISHNGSQEETKTRMVFYPGANHGIVVMCNTYDCDPGKITTAIYTALRPGEAP